MNHSAEHSERTIVRRLPARGVYDRASLLAILDEAFLCQVAIVEQGRPLTLPMVYGRDEERLYLHGSPKSRLLGALAAGAECCLSVSLLDGIVLARAALHHSLNYRSVVVFGRGCEVTQLAHKRAALECVLEHIVPGRALDARAPTDAELTATRVIALPLDEMSGKLRTGPPNDLAEDRELPIWSGLIPLHVHAGAPLGDSRHGPLPTTPAYVSEYVRPCGEGGVIQRG